MKEQELPILSSRANSALQNERGDLIREIASSHSAPRNDNVERLTIYPFPPTLGRERNIFMPEQGNGEILPDGNVGKPQRTAEKVFPIKATPAEQVLSPKEAWDKWEKDYLKEKGRPTLTFEEKQIKDAGIEMRRPPYVAGGQGEVDDATRRLEVAAEQGRRFQEEQARQRSGASQPDTGQSASGRGSNEGITQEARDLIDKAGIPTQMTSNLRRILRENRISEEDINSKALPELFDMLRARSGPSSAGESGSAGSEQTAEQDQQPQPDGEGAGGRGGTPRTATGAPEEREPQRQYLSPESFTSERGLSGIVTDINDASRISDLNLREQALRGIRDRVASMFQAGQFELVTEDPVQRANLLRQASQANQISDYARERLRETYDAMARERLVAEEAPPRGMSPEEWELYRYIQSDNIEAKKRAVDANPNFPSLVAKIAEKERLMGEGRLKIREYIGTLNPAGAPLESWLIRAIVRYEHDDAFEYLVNRIISHPVEAETKRYQSTFYGGINFSFITEAIKGRVEELRRRPEAVETQEVRRNREGRASWLEGLRTKFHLMESGAEFMHNINRAVVMGSEREFVTLAPEMIPDHFQVLQRAKLAATVMRTFDEEIQRVMARDRLITMNNYAEVTGTIFDEGGNFVRAIKGTVETLLEEYNRRLPQDQQLEPWEIKWAFHAGRNLMNISIRTAELIAHSSGTELGFKSFPQESISRIIDPIDLLGERFRVSEQRGGLRLSAMTRENFHSEKIHHGWRESNIVSILGKDRKKFEETGILNIGGVFSSWRQNNIFYLDVLDDNGNLQHISIEDFIKYNNNPLSEAQNPRLLESGLEAPNKLKNLFLQENGELRPHFEHSLGALLRLGQVIPDEKDSRSMLEAKREVRTAIWKKIAKENPLAMANILYGMKLEENTRNRALNQRLNSLSSSMYTTDVSTVTREKKDTLVWGGEEERIDQEGKLGLRQKLTIAHEEKMRRLAKGEHVSLDDVLKQSQNGTELLAPPVGQTGGEEIPPAPIRRAPEVAPSPEERLTSQERKLLATIRSLGDSLAGELAEVRFPSNPIMNDVLFETTNYSAAGTEFFKRRVGGDIVKFYEAGGKIIEVMVDPAGADTQQVLTAMQAMVKALADPNGLESGQNDVAPVFEAYLDFIKEGGPTPKGKLAEFASFFLEEGIVTNGIKHFFRKGTSLAQKYGGINAPSHNIFEMTDILESALKAEILRRGRPERSRIESAFRQGYSNILTKLRTKTEGKKGWMWKGANKVLTKLTKPGEGWQKEEEKWAWADLYERFRKKFKVKAGWKLAAWIRDLFLVYGSGAFFEFSRKTGTEKV